MKGSGFRIGISITSDKNSEVPAFNKFPDGLYSIFLSLTETE